MKEGRIKNKRWVVRLYRGSGPNHFYLKDDGKFSVRKPNVIELSGTIIDSPVKSKSLKNDRILHFETEEEAKERYFSFGFEGSKESRKHFKIGKNVFFEEIEVIYKLKTSIIGLWVGIDDGGSVYWKTLDDTEWDCIDKIKKLKPNPKNKITAIPVETIVKARKVHG